MIAIVDYGAGNLRSVQNAFATVGVAHELVREAEALQHAEKIVLPGVGHFRQMMEALDALGLRVALGDRIRAGIPFLGICLGMQALFERSEEAPGTDGLGIFPGMVERFPSEARVPHMGWNEIAPTQTPRLPVSGYFYFAHSYRVPLCAQTAAACDYGQPFSAAIESGQVFGVQFHPEKSGAAGLEILRQFAAL